MRVLLLLRGSAGCGKTTWIEQNGLKPYALSADDIRMMCASPMMTTSGKEAISQANDTTVWGMLFKLLEIRMKNGEFTVIDATNSKTSEMKRCKELCDSYRYRIYCVDFTDIPIEVAKERNKQRPELKQVPDEAIEKMYARFESQKIPSGITVIKPDELDKIYMKQLDLSGYKKVHHIGDIHGCYTALKEYLDINGGIKDDEFYIFCGDYIDRGIENVEVVQFLLSIYKKPNVYLLEGNHERWLWVWANDAASNSKDFELYTRAELDKARVSKKEVRQLYRRFEQCAYYNYQGNVYIATHGGISKVPEKLTYIATSQMIKGVGTYNEMEDVATAFENNTPDNYYQVFGHRNVKGLPIEVNDRVYSLEGGVERGGHLRCMQVCEDGTRHAFEIKNNVFKEPEELKVEETSIGDKSVSDVIIELRKNRNVAEKQFGNISAFNFTKTAFYDKIWDEQTIKARGLYINIPKAKVVARAYEKFFNVNERPETKFDMLQYKLKFPVVAYVKENGFLGIVSYNEETDSLFITTKSNPEGEFAKWFEEILRRKVSKEALDGMKDYSKEHNVSFVFECVDMHRDPHIIEYKEDSLFLLDVVRNEIEFSKYSYEELEEVANSFGLIAKQKAYKIKTWQEFFDWYYEVTSPNYKFNGRNIEGFVIEGKDGYMVKLKLAYYNFWKFMRSIAHESIRKGYIDPRKTSALVTPLANKFYAWARTLHDADDLESVPRDICTLRNMFFKTKEGEKFKWGEDKNGC